jgi:hypothetical protein
MKMLREIPKHTTSPVRPIYPIESRLDALRKRQREIVDLIIAAEQSGDKSLAYSDDESKVEREARALVRSEVEAKKPPVASASLKALLHEKAVIERALDLGTNMVTELRMAWAQQVMAERSKEYRAAVRNVALAIEALKKADSTMQELLKLFGAVGRSSGLPCANVNVAAGLNSLKSFTSAARTAGLITKEELTNV